MLIVMRLAIYLYEITCILINVNFHIIHIAIIVNSPICLFSGIAAVDVFLNVICNCAHEPRWPN